MGGVTETDRRHRHTARTDWSVVVADCVGRPLGSEAFRRVLHLLCITRWVVASDLPGDPHLRPGTCHTMNWNFRTCTWESAGWRRWSPRLHGSRHLDAGESYVYHHEHNKLIPLCWYFRWRWKNCTNIAVEMRTNYIVDLKQLRFLANYTKEVTSSEAQEMNSVNSLACSRFSKIIYIHHFLLPQSSWFPEYRLPNGSFELSDSD